MMAAKSEKFDWVSKNWVNQLLFFITGCAFFVMGGVGAKPQSSSWLYLSITLILLAVSFANMLALRDTPRYLTGLIIVLANTFLVPISAYSFGASIPVVLWTSIAYVVMTFMLSPIFVAMGALVGAVAFASYIDYDRNVFEKHPVFRQEIADFEKNMETGGFTNEIKEEDKKYYTTTVPMTLSEISAQPEVFGNPDFWYTVYRANIGLLKDPTAIVPAGVKILVPVVKGTPYKIKYYTVKRENSLETISGFKDVYNDSSKWDYLFQANKTKLREKDLSVLPGTTLIVPEIPEVPYRDFFKLALTYVAAVLMAFCWRMLIEKMYTLYTMALSKSSTSALKEVDKVKKQLEITTNEYRLLKEEVAMNILEMNRIVGFQKDYEQIENKKQ